MLELQKDDLPIKKKATGSIVLSTKNQTKLIKTTTSSTKNKTKLIKPTTDSTKDTPSIKTTLKKLNSTSKTSNSTKPTSLLIKKSSDPVKASTPKNKTIKPTTTKQTQTQLKNKLSDAKSKNPDENQRTEKSPNLSWIDQDDLVAEFRDLPSKFQESLLPDLERISKTSKVYLTKANKEITNSFKPIVAVHAADHSANKSSNSTLTANTTRPRWTLDNWKSKPALQLPEYPEQVQLDSVLKTLASFPPIVFAGEARSLEDRLAQAAVGDAFLLQGGDCAESFKEFKTMFGWVTGVVLMFGG
ncbi:hypothetical protein F0562_003249 [Nyssa sinensis]|uniref:Phospho-2-dehydro-3-deoxyheptonate aldolase n=1 Tax=Nyssa sinensis TaxID=561372 RepID=A0A5J5BYP1_9ASTE|nr:hypothetical protein F0562_003249 [Nyssa sinensis]